MNNYSIAIIGGGIAGSASALRAAQNGLDTIWFLGSKQTRKRSRSQWVANVDNMIGLHDGIVKDQVTKVLKKNKLGEAAEIVEKSHFDINNRLIIKNTVERIQAGYPNVRIIEEEISSIEKIDDNFLLKSPDNNYNSESVVLATGVMDEQPFIIKPDKTGNPVESEKWIYPFANREQVLYCIRCEGHLTRDEVVAIIGYSNIAAELAMMLHERFGVKGYILANGKPIDISEERRTLLHHYDIEIVENPITDIISDGAKQLHGFSFDTRDDILVRFALVSLGLFRVYNDLARQVGARLMDEGLPDEKRHIWINHKSESSVHNFFVVGDAVKREDEPVMKQIYTAQEYAVRAVDTIDNRRRKVLRDNILDNKKPQ
ncbi:MAG: NAD(P)/FAD-dependent oxidoreductase [Candidatus Marinimicrobia bacterium]|nr:NAD(P)/FAD-dependent oxidoreductase [Candidatus Neomarinimicrobiota bacterium]